MDYFSNHEADVKELFEKISIEVPGLDGARAMKLEGFKLAIEIMMNQAFTYGTQQSYQAVEDAIDKVFKR